MRRLFTAALLVIAASGCHLRADASRRLPPLGDQGETYLYLEPLPAGAARLSFSIESVSVERRDGTIVSLEVMSKDVAGKAQPRQKLLAWGRLPPGEYATLLFKVAKAAVSTEDGSADLLVAPEPTRVPIPLAVTAGRATLLSLSLRVPEALDRGFAFAPALTAVSPGTPVVQLAGYCSNSAAADLTVFDDLTKRVVSVLAAGAEPLGLAVDAARGRVYVALAGEDRVQALDLSTGTEWARVQLRNGDRPRELALSPDGRFVVVANQGSNTVSFVDPTSSSEIDRVRVGDEPWSLLMDRSGRRAYVFNRRSNSMTVLDVANRSVVTTVPTDAEPLRGQLNRAGTRLYVVHAGSPYMTEFSLPDLRVARRVFVGLGASTIKVDARTDLIYVGRSDDRVIQVYDPFSLMPATSIEVPDAVTQLAIDDAENTLLALLPDRRSVVFIDLTSRKVLNLVDVGSEPYAVALTRERN